MNLHKLLVPLFKDYPLYSQEWSKDHIVIAKLFNPMGSATWYLFEYDPVEKIAFGYVSWLVQGCDEYGYISINELEGVKLSFGLWIEMDLDFVKQPISNFINKP